MLGFGKKNEREPPSGEHLNAAAVDWVYSLESARALQELQPPAALELVRQLFVPLYSPKSSSDIHVLLASMCAPDVIVDDNTDIHIGRNMAWSFFWILLPVSAIVSVKLARYVPGTVEEKACWGEDVYRVHVDHTWTFHVPLPERLALSLPPRFRQVTTSAETMLVARAQDHVVVKLSSRYSNYPVLPNFVRHIISVTTHIAAKLWQTVLNY